MGEVGDDNGAPPPGSPIISNGMEAAGFGGGDVTCALTERISNPVDANRTSIMATQIRLILINPAPSLGKQCACSPT
jgi:hypothetical protein